MYIFVLLFPVYLCMPHLIVVLEEEMQKIEVSRISVYLTALYYLLTST